VIDFPMWAYFSIGALLFILMCWYLRDSHLCVSDMFTDPKGKLSQSKIWMNICNGTMTVIVWKQGTEDKLSEEMALIFMAVIGGSELAKKALEIWKGKP
jgi:hypothetical protein